jgi:hypothetical protein
MEWRMTPDRLMDADISPPVHQFSPGEVFFFILLGAVVLVGLIVFFWALSIHKREKRRNKRHHPHRTNDTEQFQKVAADIQRHRGRRRSEHRPINPTLAQTGGLPPLRDAGKPPPPPAPQP